MTSEFEKKLYEYLTELKIISQKSLDEVIKEAKDSPKSFSELLLEKDLITDENLGNASANLYSLPFMKLSSIDIDPEILDIIPELMAKKQKVIAFEKNQEGLKIATCNPENKEIFDFIAKKTGDNIKVYFSTERDINEAFSEYSQSLQKTFEDLIGMKKNISEPPVTEIVDTLIKHAYQNKASDIHIEPGDDKSTIRFRIDSVLHDVLSLPREIHDQVITRIKVLAKLKTDEHLSAQDGKIQVKLENEDLDIRISALPLVDGEKCVMRLLSSKTRQFSLLELGLSDRDLKKVQNGITKPTGMVLSTGPTGSGKTTSIYAIIKVLNKRDVNISTIEDPVEYEIEGINQIQANVKTNLTFANGLRSILRQDPNIIFIGEIRDAETAGIAINSAMTGHLVLSTLHTNNAATTLPRLLDMGIEPFLVSSTVNTIIGQRLVRKICNKCKVSISTDRAKLKEFLTPEQIKKYFTKESSKGKIRSYMGKGCDICHQTGYEGRIGIFEVLEVTQNIRELIMKRANADEIEMEAKKDGMTTMFENGLEKVKDGITTLEEILRVTKIE